MLCLSHTLLDDDAIRADARPEHSARILQPLSSVTPATQRDSFKVSEVTGFEWKNTCLRSHQEACPANADGQQAKLESRVRTKPS